ncbi:MAG: citrate/2-methylcitrate synthase, partial [Candidatus Caldarchaeum sp.]|nr:citrate/2-methylcitrate synthase [Candidatus Caldarchaeum sp.]
MSITGVYKGLDNVPIKETVISTIDGEKGKLYYVGYSVEELAEKSNYEEVSFLLLHKRLPTGEELKDFSNKLMKERTIPNEIWSILEKTPPGAPLMDKLKAGVDLLGLFDGEAEKTDKAARLSTAIRIISKIATLVAGVYRLKKGLQPLEPDPGLNHASNFLYMATGKKPNALESKIMDVTFILHAEHELPASSTAALVVASTLSDLYSAVSAGIGALKGPLHGGANERALEMLMSIKTPEEAEQYVLRELASKRKIMGFGHRVYKT